jgi:hypothetical protein
VVFCFLLTGIMLPAFAAPTAPFAKTLYPVLDKAGCRSCHHAAGVASATRLQFPEADAAAARIEDFGRSLVTFVDKDHPDQSLLLRKPTNRTPHTGGERITPGSAEEAALQAWIDRLTKMSAEEIAKARQYKNDGHGSVAAPGPVLRRLTHSQYNNTVRDLVGELSQPASQFPPEGYVNGFKNQYQAQSLSPIQYEAYSAAAEKLARNAFRRGDEYKLIPCKPSPACRAEFVRSFGLKAFRRPLTAAEQKRYESLFTTGGDFTKGAQAVVEAVLQSPNFLFFLDTTNDPALKPYAAASRLAYSLWNTMPDAALLQSAASGELNTPKGFERAALRLLADPKAKDALEEWVTQWMRFDRVLETGRDRRTYPKFTRETAVAMTGETKHFIADLVWNNRDFMELFTGEYGYVNQELASLYGVKVPEKEFDRVPFAADSERAGLLGQALFLTLTSNPNDTSPTSRGLFIREQFLCQHVADPPPGVSTTLPPLSETKPQTNRQRLAMHAADKTCAGCHSLMDPIGFGLEKFDAIGGRREKAELVFYPLDRKSKEPPKKVQLDLDTTGFVAGIADSNFTSPRELGKLLARTPQCQECVVKQYFRYVSGRSETAADRPLIRHVAESFRSSQFKFQQMIISLMVAREFPQVTGVRDVSSR